MKTQSKICKEKKGRLVTLDFRWGGKWTKSVCGPFKSVEEAQEHAGMIGARIVRIQPFKKR